MVRICREVLMSSSQGRSNFQAQFPMTIHLSSVLSGAARGPYAMTDGTRDWIREVDIVLPLGTRTKENGTT